MRKGPPPYVGMGPEWLNRSCLYTRVKKSEIRPQSLFGVHGSRFETKRVSNLKQKFGTGIMYPNLALFGQVIYENSVAQLKAPKNGLEKFVESSITRTAMHCLCSA